MLSALGAGGMGEVYRARDTRLNRDVAIKVLLPAVANDPDRLARFSREAQVLASLNHPNIAQIYGIEDAAIVMELVDGEDLAARIARGPIPLDEALPIARQMAEALEAAHDHGIIHRDLKPANIKVRPDGTVKVLDFGLAKAIETGSAIREPGSIDLPNSPTLSNHATQAGMILGTAAYMSPEQAAGKAVDKRSDLWALGVVLMEMLTGRQVFKGETVSHLIAAVLKDEPDWSALPADTPPSIRRLLRRCLHKDRKLRLPDAADVRLEIDDAREPSNAATTNPRRALMIAASLVVGGLLAGASVWILVGNPDSAPPADVVRFAIHDSDEVVISRVGNEVAISPDGKLLAFIGFGVGGARIWIRELDSLAARPLAGTEGAVAMCWSPDGQSLAFSGLGQIKTVAITGGAPRTMATIGGDYLGWGRDGRLVFSGLRTAYHLGATGGEAASVIQARSGETLGAMVLLPDDRHVLMAIDSPDPANAGTFAVSLDRGTRTRVLPFPTMARYSLGRLLFVRDRVLYAQPFELTDFRLSGEPVPLAEPVVPAFSASAQGAVAYVPGSTVTPRVAAQESAATQLAWMDRSGRVERSIDQAAGGIRPTLSPDDRRLAMMLRGDIWILELGRAVLSRLTNGGRPADPTWLPDSQRMLFRRSALRDGKDIIVSIGTGSAAETEMFGPEDGTHLHVHPTDVSPDGRYLAYDTFDKGDLLVRALTGDPVVQAHGAGAGSQTQGVFSPDSRWLAYTSDSSGRFEVYVDGVPEPGPRHQVSANGGSSPRWRRDGKELFYLAPDGTLTAVPVRSLQPLDLGPPVALFQFFSAIRGAPAGTPPYDVARDGQRFIVSSVVRRTDPSLNVLLNWPALLASKTIP